MYSSTALSNPARTEVSKSGMEIELKETPDSTAIESSKESSTGAESSWRIDEMVILQCNIDDMTAEGVAHMLETFISRHGARDAWVYHTFSIRMEWDLL